MLDFVGWKKHTGKESGMTGSAKAACFDLCKKDPACAAATWAPTICFTGTLAQAKSTQQQPTVIAESIIRSDAGTPKKKPVLKDFPGSLAMGNRMGGKELSSGRSTSNVGDECRKMCVDTNGCVAYTAYNPNNGKGKCDIYSSYSGNKAGSDRNVSGWMV